MRLPSHDQAGTLEVKMTPMIDVVFLLLIFFVWTSSFETPEFDLPSSLADVPAAGSQANLDQPPPVEAFDEIVVKLLIRDGLTVIEFGGQRIESADELQARLAEVIALGVQPPVIIDPEDLVTMDRAVEVYDAARSAGADRVLYATRVE
ncbi:MAG: biopolymer transporter ExbD [Planctomycetales bacterium]|nr:biopolymer transporter ExbD [Planctomycetales bacterium]